MAIRVCNNPRITSSILSREITELVAERAKEAVAISLMPVVASNDRPYRVPWCCAALAAAVSPSQ